MSIGGEGDDVTCYTAEAMVARLWTTNFKTDDETHDFFDDMVSSRFMQARYPRVYKRPPKLKIVHALPYSKTFLNQNRIELSVFSCTDWDICHEMAHICNPAWSEHHGPKFFDTQLTLMKRFMSPGAAQSLKYAYKALGVL